MRIRLEKRREPSRVMLALSPIGAVAMTMIVGAIIFAAIGYDGPRAVADIFFTPVLASYKWQDVAAKAAPLTGDQRLSASPFDMPFPPGLYIAFALALVFWLVMARSEFGLGVRIVGEAPKAARYAGYKASNAVWSTLLISGAMAGLAGVL